jgi:hypothetical protein
MMTSRQYAMACKRQKHEPRSPAGDACGGQQNANMGDETFPALVPNTHSDYGSDIDVHSIHGLSDYGSDLDVNDIDDGKLAATTPAETADASVVVVHTPKRPRLPWASRHSYSLPARRPRRSAAVELEYDVPSRRAFSGMRKNLHLSTPSARLTY